MITFCLILGLFEIMMAFYSKAPPAHSAGPILDAGFGEVSAWFWEGFGETLGEFLGAFW